jgi:hypothetical protein
MLRMMLAFTPSFAAEIDFQKWKEYVPEEFRPYLLYGLLALIAMVIARRVWQTVASALRRRRPPTIHPSLQKYNVDHAEVDRQHREMARRILATSTGARLAGYRVARQVEAVFVEGYRTPDEAITALKATAAERGANAVLNVQTDRTTAGRCSASGDAVVVTGLSPGFSARPKPSSATPPSPGAAPQRPSASQAGPPPPITPPRPKPPAPPPPPPVSH